MLCGVISGPTYEKAKMQKEQAEKGCCLLEWRLDSLLFGPDKLTLLLERGPPALFTFGKRVDRISAFLPLQPQFVDLDWESGLECFKDVHQASPGAQIICSYHNQEATPTDLKSVGQRIKNPFASLYKVVTHARSALDGMRLLQFLKNYPEPCIAFCMGEKGQFSRILAPILGSRISYLAPNRDSVTVPGQLDLDTFRHLYQGHRLSGNTRVFGLIGDPIEKSPSHVTHNRILQQMGMDAVYVKIPLLKEELASFLESALALRFSGLSVTTPLKEEIVQFIEKREKEGGAVNTLKFEGEKVFGLNTDGEGALDAIEAKTSVRGKTLAILGAGGAAWGVAAEALRRGAYVTLINRTEETAIHMAKALGCGWSAKVPERGVNLLVNCTPVSPSWERFPVPDLAMDATYSPYETDFLKEAKKRGCQVVHGVEMFINQAVKQFAFWFGSSLNQDQIREILHEAKHYC